MQNQDKTKEQLVGELGELHQRIAELESAQVDQEHTEETLRESREWLKTVFDSVQAGILVIDAETHVIVDANPVAVETIGAPREQVVGHVCHRFVCPEEEGHCAITDLGWTVDRSERVLLNASGESIPILKSVSSAILNGRKCLIESFLNITEQKQAEDALRESEERFRQLAENVQDAFWLGTPGVGKDRQILYVNPAFETVFGIGREEIYKSDNAWLEIVHDQDRDRVLELLEEFLRDQNDYDLEYRVVQPDGSVRWIWAKAFAIRGGKGEICRTAGLAQDITERKQAEKVLRESEERYRLLFEQADDAIIVSRVETDEILELNRRACELMGYTREELLTMKVPDLQAPEVRGEAGRVIKGELAKYKDGFFEALNVHRDGTRIPVEISSSQMTRAGEKLALSIVRDITERKRAEERLQRSLEETARGQRLLLALSQASQAVQRARTPEEVYQTIGDEIAGLGYHATIFTLTDDRTHLAVSYLTFKPALLRAAEKLTGLSAKNYRFPLKAGGFYERIIEQGKVVFSDPGAGPIAEALPGPVRPLAKQLADVLGIGKAIYAPLKFGGETRSVMTVIGADLTEADVPAVMAFASQAAIAIENAELYQTAQQELTERKRAEASLRESEERFRQMAESSRDVFWMRDLKSRDLLYITPAYERLWGQSIEDAHTEPTSWMSSVHPEDRDRIAAAFEKQIRGEPTENEYRIVWRDGTIHWIRDRATPILDEVGEAYRTFGVVEDITDRKQVEEALRESEERSRNIVESVPIGMHVYELQPDDRLVFVGANPAADDILGIANDQFVGKTIEEAFPPLIETEVPERYRAAASSGEAWQTDQVDYEKGQIKGAFAVHAFQTSPGRMVAAFLDITERKQAEQERERLLAQIRDQAQRMQHILDTVPEGVLLLDADEQIILVNPVAERELVALSDARTGDTLTRLGDRPLAELLTSPPKGLWHEVATDDRSFQVIARPVENGPAPAGWVLVVRDVTQQREVQLRVQQQERLAAVGQLAAGIAHDFNNIMATVVLYAQMTARMEGLPATVRERMETIDGQAKHATRLIQQILDFSRRAVLERRPLDLAMLLKEHVVLLERTLPESIEIKLDCEPDAYATPFTVNADPTRMQQMVTNLALNAREAMPRGGELRIGLERIVIQPGESPLLPEMEPGQWVKVTVSDTGTGIPPDALPHIFEPFFTTRAPLGSGLGLAQVHGIVGAHEGRIDVETRVGKGTTFTIYLPVHRSEPSPALSRTELPALPTGHGETILVVEDNAVVRRALADSLELLNYQVLEVSNGQEALETLEERQGEVALVLSDVVMPRMSGTALLHALRERGLTVQVVMLTGHPIKREMEQLRAHGMTDWLAKPPRLEELAQALARALGRD